MHESHGGPHGPGRLAAHAALFALWLTAAFAVAAHASGDRYPGYFLLWTGVLLAGGLIVPLAVLGALEQPTRRSALCLALVSAYCILFAATLSVDVGPALRTDTHLGLARMLVLGAALALAAWNLRRARSSRLGLGSAMAVMCLAWCLCGVLRSTGVPEALARRSILLPLCVATGLLLPGLPSIGPLFSRLRLVATLAACATLALLPGRPRVLVPGVQALPAGPPAAGARSVVLIVLDALRRDHMSLYGYSKKTTPALERRAGSGLVFDDATSVAACTLPSHASMFTGLWPRSHGAHAIPGDREHPAQSIRPLSQENVTLAEIAREHGYRTAGFSSNSGFPAPRFGLNQGFEHYLSRRPRRAGVLLGTARSLAWRWNERRAMLEEMPYFTAPEMTRAAIAWLRQHQDSPFFLFLNYMDAHIPNAAPGSQGIQFEDEAPLRTEFADYVLGGPMTPAERRGIVNEYDREVIHLDHWVGLLLDYLEQSGVGARTLVVLTSDHGESLGEHALIGHGKDLYAEAVDVPLIVWEPGAAAGRVSRPVQSLDVFPTILRYLGLPIPPQTQGQPMLEADHPIVSEQYYGTPGLIFGPVGHRFDRIVRTIRVGEHRYFTGSNGEERLFHRLADPLETQDLIATRPEVAAAGRARLEEWMRSTLEAAAPSGPPRKGDAETLQNLRALGYVH